MQLLRILYQFDLLQLPLMLVSPQRAEAAGLRVGGPGAELIVGACEPSAGRFGASTEIILADQVLQVFQKVHILPYKAPLFFCFKGLVSFNQRIRICSVNLQ